VNILFITLLDIRTLEESGIYSDLMREFVKNGHHVYIISPVERRMGLSTHMVEDGTDGLVHILKLKIGNIQKTNVIEKGISTVMIERQLLKGIKTYFRDVRFDLVLYSTPPITLVKPIAFVKKRDHAATYLMLKDIFPQNAVDMGMMSKTGIKGFLYRHFRKKEKRLYELSDRIGCMSQANCDYVIRHNPQIDPAKVEICPNSIDVKDMSLRADERHAMRDKYGIPKDKTVFVYGGNLGKPQGIPFLIECLKTQVSNPETYFLIVGDGTEYTKLERFFEEHQPQNMKLLKRLPKDDYDHMVAACDVGMIFLDHRFSIPNFPSRLLSYMQAKLPVLACTDPHTDIGKVVTEGGFGCWCESDDTAAFSAAVDACCEASLAEQGECAFRYLQEQYSAQRGYAIIMNDQQS